MTIRKFFEALIPSSFVVVYGTGILIGYHIGSNPIYTKEFVWTAVVALILLIVADYLHDREIKAILRGHKPNSY